jgi:hypothetical protein
MNSRLPIIIYGQIENYISNPCDLPVWCSGNGLFAGFGISLAPAKLLVYNYFRDGANGSLEILLIVVVVVVAVVGLFIYEGGEG